MAKKAFNVEEFTEMYESRRHEAMAVLLDLEFPPDIAEDAVQAAALYFLSRQRQHVTWKLFLHYVRMRAYALKESAYGSERRPAKIVYGLAAYMSEEEDGNDEIC